MKPTSALYTKLHVARYQNHRTHHYNIQDSLVDRLFNVHRTLGIPWSVLTSNLWP